MNCDKTIGLLFFRDILDLQQGGIMSVFPVIVVVEDDKELATYIEQILTTQRYTVYVAHQGTRGLKLVDDVQPSLVLLDLTLPDIEGKTVCKHIKDKYPTIPVVMLTARSSTEDIVAGLQVGADDYITKPFQSEELLARVQTRLRAPENNAVLRLGDLEVNTQNFEVHRAGKLIPLTHTEYSLLHYLILNQGRVITREMILSNVWSYSPDVESRVVDVYIGYLRKKLEGKGQKKLIHSVRGFGYVLKTD